MLYNKGSHQLKSFITFIRICHYNYIKSSVKMNSIIELLICIKIDGKNKILEKKKKKRKKKKKKK